MPENRPSATLPATAEEFLRAVEQHAILSSTDVAGNILYAKQLFCNISGYSLPELIGKNHRLIKSDQHPPEVYEDLWRTISSGKVWHGEVCNRRKSGELYWVKSTIVPVLDADGIPVRYISTRTDITANKQLEHRLALAERAKSAFLDTMTHELKTPLNIILGTGQLLETVIVNPELHQLCVSANDSARALLRMIDMALQYAALDGVRTKPAQAPSTLDDCIRAALWKNKDLAQKFNVTLIDSITADVRQAELVIDQKMFMQLLELVVDNAIRFNRPAGTVTLTAIIQNQALAVTVTDTGVGMSADQIARLPEPFTRFCDDGNRSGFGLGMALGQRLADAMGAHIEVVSAPEHGTTVRIIHPL
jgi:PAS domain S-box-containing protein